MTVLPPGTGTRSQINNVIGNADDFRFVLDDEGRCCPCLGSLK